MLIPLQYIVDKYKPKFKGVIHVGAHEGQEYNDYKSAGISPIVFFEPCNDAFKKLYDRFKGVDYVYFHKWAIGADNKEDVKMLTASFNKGESNSILKPHLHLQQHPEVIFDDYELVHMKTLDDAMWSHHLPLYNLINMDVQGYEGEVLKGATETLKHIDYVYTEVNRDYTYSNNALIEEIDELLKDFERVETKWASPKLSWGDSFFIRKSLL